MNTEQIEYLKNKIVQIANHIEKQTEDKKALVKSYSIEINDSQSRLNAYAKAVTSENIEFLNEVMDVFEFNEFEKIGK